MRVEKGSEERGGEGVQKGLEPSEEKAEFAAGGGEDGAVAVAALVMVAFHAVLGLEVADHQLDRGPAPHFASGGLDDAAHLERFYGYVNRLGVSPARGYVIHLLPELQKEVSMGKPYSDDLRERIVGAVAAGESRRAAARKFGVSASCAVKLLQRWETTGSVRPDRQGAPNRCKLDAHAAWLLDVVEEEPDITLSEIQARLLGERDMTASIGAIWGFFDRRNISFKKNRARR